MEKGLVQIYTGEGKGKTTAAIGQAVRAKGRGLKVLLIQFLKEKKGSGEISLLESLGVKVICSKGGKYKWLFLDKIGEDEKRKIKTEWTILLGKITQEILAQRYDLLILDEINVAVHYGLINEDRLIDFIKKKPDGLEIILTGRHASPRLIQAAHLVSEVKNIKHPFEKGIKARKGIEY